MDVPIIEGLEGLRVIGRGGFATVYRARQTAFDRDVAVKVLQRSGLGTDDQLRFERECKVMGALSSHPSIVTLFDAGFTADERPYLVMTLIPGGSLQDRIRIEPLSWQETTDVGVRLAGALETAHRAGIIHRDVKPANVLRSEYGAQLGDFGIARLHGGHETQSGLITASLEHAAPEILDGGPPGVTADVYSLGSTLFAALDGHSAFADHLAQGLVPLLRMVATGPVPDLRERGVPDEIATIVERSMAKDPGDRYATAADLGEALRDAQATLGIAQTDLQIVGDPRSTPPADLPTERIDAPTATITDQETAIASPATSTTTTGRTRRPWLLPAVFGGIVALVVALFALWPRDDSGEPDVATTNAAPASEPTATNPIEQTATTLIDQSATTPIDPSATGDAPDASSPADTTAPPATSPVAPSLPPDAALSATALTSTEIPVDTQVDGRTLTAIDGMAFDPTASEVLLVKEPAPRAIAEADPSLTDPAVFAVPIDITAEAGDGTLLDIAAGSSATLLREDGSAYGLELDVEGMTVLDDGSFFVVSEGSGELDSDGGPFVHRFDPTGRFLSALRLPEWYLPDPAAPRGFSDGRGLHGIDVRRDEPSQVVVAVEAPLQQDHDPGRPTEQKIARLIAFDSETGEPITEWGYPLEPIPPEVAADNENARSLIVDIATLDDGSLVVLESTTTPDGREVGLHRVVLDEGSPPSPTAPPVQTKSPIEIPDGDALETVTNTRSIAAGASLDDGRPSLLLASDNAFGEAPTTIAVIGLDSAA